MKRIYPQNYLIMIFGIFFMYGILIYVIATKTEDYFAIPLISGAGIFLLNRRMKMTGDSFSITQGIGYFKVRYADVKSIRYTKYKPFMSRVKIDVIEFETKGNKRFKFMHRMYSADKINEIIEKIRSENNKVEIRQYH